MPRPRAQASLYALLALVAGSSILYWQDPWFWRNYLRFLTSGDPVAEELLPPDEEIRGDGSYRLPVALPGRRIGSLDDPAGRYLDEWRDDPRGAITLRELLQMRSGLMQYRFTLNPFAADIRWLNSGRSGEVVLRTPLVDPEPGSRHDYNNINSELLGMVLERVYGQGYSALLATKLWQPMGGERARVHTDRPGGRAFTSCCLAAPAMDWARIGMLFLERGSVNGQRIVGADWIEQMITPSPAAGWYGLHIWLGRDDPPVPPDSAGSSGAIATEPFLARDTYLTWGRGQQHVFVVPSQELVIVRLGPALGRSPIRPGFDITFLVNTAIRGILSS